LRKIGLHPNFWYPLAGFFSDTIFAEDKFVPEAEQRAYDLQGADLNQEVLSFIMDLRHSSLLLEVRRSPDHRRTRGIRMPNVGLVPETWV
jgi:hypothetical protein